MGTTSSEGRLKLTTLSPGQHRIRLSLDGYGDDSRDVVIAGASMVLEVTLEAIQPAASASAATKAVEPSSQSAGALPLQDSRPVIYVFRRSKFVASGQHPDVYCDGVSVGQIHAGTYLTVRVSPGKHVATSTGQHITNQASVELDGVNGGAYYIELAVVMGPKVTMALVSKEIGESEIKGLKPR